MALHAVNRPRGARAMGAGLRTWAWVPALGGVVGAVDDFAAVSAARIDERRTARYRLGVLDSVTLRLVAVDHPEARRLQEAQQSELGALFGFRGFALADPPAFRRPRGAFLIALDNGVAVACGGICPLEALPGTAEVKRMYTVPSHRRKGIGVRVLRALEAEARTLGFTAAALETGTVMDWAVRLYRSQGYASIPLYPPYLASTHSTCLGKSLTGAST